MYSEKKGGQFPELTKLNFEEISRCFNYYSFVCSESITELPKKTNSKLLTNIQNLKREMYNPNINLDDSLVQLYSREILNTLYRPLRWLIDSNHFIKSPLLKMDSLYCQNLILLPSEAYYTCDSLYGDCSHYPIEITSFKILEKAYILNGYFFYQDLRLVLNDEVIKYLQKTKINDKEDYKSILNFYTKLLDLRQIKYTLIKKRKSMLINLPELGIQLNLNETNILYQFEQLVQGGSIQSVFLL